MADRIKLEPVAREETGPRSAFEITFPSSTLWGLIGCIMSFAVSIVEERQSGTLLRLRVAPMNWSQILAGKGLACLLTSAAVCTMMVVLGLVAFGVRIQSVTHLAMGIVSMAICFTGMMMLMSTLGRTERAVTGAGWGMLMPLAMMGGGMIPLIFMPSWVITVASISPFKWGVLAMEGAIWRSFSFTEMLLPCGILIATGLITFSLGVRILARAES